MRTEEEGFIGFLSDAIFRMDMLLEDLVALKRRVEAEGFLDAEVVLDDLRFSDDKERVVITIAIIEHQPYTVGDIEIEIERLEPGRGRELRRPRTSPTSPRSASRAGSACERASATRASAEEKGRREDPEEYFKRSYIDAAGVRPARAPRPRARERRRHRVS